MNWLNKISPRIKLGSNGYYGMGVINPWRVISDHEYFVFEEGNGALIIDGITYTCPEKSFIIIPSGQRHISYAYSEAVLLHWAHFDWTPVDYSFPSLAYMEPTPPNPEHFHPAPDFIPKQVLHGQISDPQVFLLLQQLENRVHSEDEFERMLVSATALELFIRLLSPGKTNKKLGKNTFSAADEIRLQLTRIAHEPMDKTLPLEQLLATDGYSYSRQERLFKEEFGITPHQYITLLRVERIKQLLDDYTLTISDIADQMGFNDLAYFSRFVTKHLGVSPRKLRSLYK